MKKFNFGLPFLPDHGSSTLDFVPHSFLDNLDGCFARHGQAVALLLSLGVATGSISDVVRVASLLLKNDAPALPPSAGASLGQLRDHSSPAKVGSVFHLLRNEAYSRGAAFRSMC